MSPSDLLLLSTTMTADKRQMRDRILRIAKPRKQTLIALLAVLALTGAVCTVTFTGATARETPEPPVAEDTPQVNITQESELPSGGEAGQESGGLGYDPIDVTINAAAEPSYLEPRVRNAAVPPFLDEEQQTLYHRAMELYDRMWGGDTSFIDAYYAEDGSFYWDERSTAEIDGTIYLVASGPYANWADFAALIGSVFTPSFWDAKNGDGNGFPPIYVEYQGRLAYIEASRGAGYFYNENIPDEFRLEEKTDREIRFTVIGHYSPVWLKYDETVEERDARLAAGEEFYTLEFPIRMVNTANGWRFAEFHDPLADEYLPDGWLEAHGWYEPSLRPTAEELAAYGIVYDDASLDGVSGYPTDKLVMYRLGSDGAYGEAALDALYWRWRSDPDGLSAYLETLSPERGRQIDMDINAAREFRYRDDEAREAYREMLSGMYRELSETNYAWFFHNNHSWELSGRSRASDNQFAVVDLDGDGTSELLLRYLTGRFDDFEYVFGSDYGPFELAEFYNMPAYASYYEGGLIAVPVGGSVYVCRWNRDSFAYPPEGAGEEEAQRWLEEQLGGARELDIPWQALTPENIDALIR